MDQPRLAWIAAALALILFAVLMVGILAIPQLTALDHAALLALSDCRSDGMNEAMRWITVLGSTAWNTGLVAVSDLVLLMRRDRSGTTRILLAGVGSWMLMLAAKPIVGRDRPTIVEPLVEAGGYAFPSGHALMTTAVYLTLALVLQKHLQHRQAATLVTALACLAILLVGVSRVYLGVHHPSDVLGGVLLGLFWVLLFEGTMGQPRR